MKSIALLVLLALCACQPGDPQGAASDDTTPEPILTEDGTVAGENVVFDEDANRLFAADTSVVQPKPQPIPEPQPVEQLDPEQSCDPCAAQVSYESHGVLGIGILDGERRQRGRGGPLFPNRPHLLNRNHCDRPGLFR